MIQTLALVMRSIARLHARGIPRSDRGALGKESPFRVWMAAVLPEGSVVTTTGAPGFSAGSGPFRPSCP
jgi:hypothetical protein